MVGTQRLLAIAGSVQISYRDESEVILEGKSYFVLLDPADGDDSKDPSARKPRKRGKPLVLTTMRVPTGPSGARDRGAYSNCIVGEWKTLGWINPREISPLRRPTSAQRGRKKKRACSCRNDRVI
jgi:hypothetical protein